MSIRKYGKTPKINKAEKGIRNLMSTRGSYLTFDKTWPTKSWSDIFEGDLVVEEKYVLYRNVISTDYIQGFVCEEYNHNIFKWVKTKLRKRDVKEFNRLPWSKRREVLAKLRTPLT